MNERIGSEGPGTARQSPESGFVQPPRRQIVMTMICVMSAAFLAVLGQMVVAAAMPRIVSDLGGFDRYTWVAAAYLVASTVAIPITGRLTDIYGHKGFLVLGIVVFIMGSVPASFSQSMNQLIASRALQGIGGGILITMSLRSVPDLFPPRQRGRFQGLIALVFGMASVIGPSLGGFITDQLSWNWIFLINLPVGIPVLLLTIRTFPNIRPEAGDRKLDYPGMMALVLSVVTTMLALSWAGVQYDWASPQVMGLLGFGLVMAAVLLVVESRSDSPIMPLEIYRNRMVSISVIVAFFTAFGLFGSVIFLPLFFQAVLGASATGSGGFLTPMMLGIVIGSIVAGARLSRSGGQYRRQGLVSTGCMAAGMFLISTMNESTSFAAAVGYIVIMGLGVGGTLSTFAVAVQNSVPDRFMGTATSALHFFRLIGGTTGLALLGAVMRHRFSLRVEETVSATVREALPPGRLDAIKDNPRVLIDPSATGELRSGFSHDGADGVEIADALLSNLNSALSGALADVFTVGAVTMLVAVGMTLFLTKERERSEEEG